MIHWHDIAIHFVLILIRQDLGVTLCMCVSIEPACWLLQQCNAYVVVVHLWCDTKFQVRPHSLSKTDACFTRDPRLPYLLTTTDFSVILLVFQSSVVKTSHQMFSQTAILQIPWWYTC